MKIAVIFGGLSTERDISIKSGISVFNALKDLNHKPLLVDPALGNEGFFHSLDEIADLPTLSSLDKNKYRIDKYLETIANPIFDEIEFAFIVLHGKYGEDGTIQTLFELKNIPYSGSNPKASSIGMDKNLSKIIFIASGIPTPRWITLRANELDNFEICEEIRDDFGKKMVIKPNDQGSTFGTTIVMDGNLDEIYLGLKKASEFSDIILVERYIEGKEITVGIVGEEPLPVIEIIPQSGFYDFEHKYTKGKTEYVCPAELPSDVSELVQDIAMQVFNTIGCNGFARVDFRLTEDFQPFVLEINTIPGFTDTSLVPKAAKAKGIEFPELCQKIVDEGLEYFKRKNSIK
ncbi:MAG: D-alanine--D-alanine ligase [Ignavibacteria bacterium]|nr:D-alanine--D-alanine ligase [Ignavibacteria bacterium]